MFGANARIAQLNDRLDELEAQAEEDRKEILGHHAARLGLQKGQVYRLRTFGGEDFGLWMRDHDDGATLLVGKDHFDTPGRRSGVGYLKQCWGWSVTPYANSPKEAFAKLAAEEAMAAAAAKKATDEVFDSLLALSKPYRKRK